MVALTARRGASLPNARDLALTALTSGKTLWSSGTSGNPGAYAQFGTDGNLAVYTASGTSKWSTGLTATSGATLQLRNDSTLAVVASDGTTTPWKQRTGTTRPLRFRSGPLNRTTTHRTTPNRTG